MTSETFIFYLRTTNKSMASSRILTILVVQRYIFQKNDYSLFNEVLSCQFEVSKLQNLMTFRNLNHFTKTKNKERIEIQNHILLKLFLLKDFLT